MAIPIIRWAVVAGMHRTAATVIDEHRTITTMRSHAARPRQEARDCAADAGVVERLIQRRLGRRDQASGAPLWPAFSHICAKGTVNSGCGCTDIAVRWHRDSRVRRERRTENRCCASGWLDDLVLMRGGDRDLLRVDHPLPGTTS